MGSNPSNFKGDKLPVEKVSWNDCQTFIEKLNSLTAGKRPAGRSFRLPTEAEWEYTARGGSKSRGYTYAGSNTIDDVAWYEGNCGSKTHDVAGKSADELGLYDMSGNVYEWCADWFEYYPSSPQTNPTGPLGGYARIIRGGGWFDEAVFCRAAYRFGRKPTNSGDNLGLRLAL